MAKKPIRKAIKIKPFKAKRFSIKMPKQVKFSVKKFKI